MKLRSFTLLYAVVLWAVCIDPCLGQEEKNYAVQVKVTMKNGMSFEALILDQEIIDYLDEHTSPDFKDFDPNHMLTLHYMLGLNGTMGVRVLDISSMESQGRVSKKQLDEKKEKIMRRIAAVRARDRVRREQLQQKRAAALQKKQEELKQLEEEREAKALEAAEREKIKWILRYPPDEGWGPEKKEELYRRGIVTDIYPDDHEQTFLDHYTEWLSQYEIWVKLQEEAEESSEQPKAEEKSME
jgi:hypothetical protein